MLFRYWLIYSAPDLANCCIKILAFGRQTDHLTIMTDPENLAAASQNNANASNPSATANGEHEEPKEIVAKKVSGTAMLSRFFIR